MRAAQSAILLLAISFATILVVRSQQAGVTQAVQEKRPSIPMKPSVLDARGEVKFRCARARSFAARPG